MQRVMLQRVLICGFADFVFMVELIRALDRELPKGSSVTLFSQRTTQDTVGARHMPAHACTCSCLGLLSKNLRQKIQPALT